MSQPLKRMLFLFTCLCLLTALASGTSSAGKPAKKPDAELTNPALVYRDFDDGGLFLMSFDGAIRQRLTRPRRGANDYDPVWSPDGNRICFFRSAGGNEGGGDLCIINWDGTEETIVRSLGSPGAPIPSYHNDDIAWSPDATRLVYAGGSEGERGLWEVDLVNPQHLVTKLIGVDGDYAGSPQFSPDLDIEKDGYQGRLAFHDYVLIGKLEVGDIRALEITIDANGMSVGDCSNLTAHLPPGNYEQPAWSPDGASLALIMDFRSVGGSVDIAVMPRNLMNDPVPLTSTSVAFSCISWSPDGEYLVFDDISDTTGTWDLFRFDLDSFDRVNLTATGRATEWAPSWNPAWDPANP